MKMTIALLSLLISLPGISATFDVKTTFQRSCNICHGPKAMVPNSPKKKSEWDKRLALRKKEGGMAKMVENSYKGLNAMPPKGLCATCDKEQLKVLIEYMIENAPK